MEEFSCHFSAKWQLRDLHASEVASAGLQANGKRRLVATIDHMDCWFSFVSFFFNTGKNFFARPLVVKFNFFARPPVVKCNFFARPLLVKCPRLQLLRFCLHARNSQTSKSQFAMLAIYGLLAVCMQFTCCLHAVCASLHKLWPTNAIRKFYDFTLRAAVCLQLASNLRVLVCMQRACNLLSVCLNF